MPLYEFVCRDCECESELLVRSSSEVPECPQCGSTKLAKLLSVPAAHASGSARGAMESPSGPPTGPCGGGCACFPSG